MKQYGIIQFFAIGVGCLAMNTNCQAVSNPRPNIVFILADDLGWADLSAYGNRFNESPNLDQLAREGVMFTNAYSAGPVCSPTRASIMSGQYPARLGFVCHIPGHWRPFEKVLTPVNRAQNLPSEVITIAEQLKTVGYVNAYFGKWHLGNEQPNHPLNQGFDVANIGQGFYNTRFIPARDDYKDLRFNDRITRFGIDFIESCGDKPFFLVLGHFDVHVVLDADKEVIDKFQRKEKIPTYPCNPVYAAMVEHLDHSVGKIIRKLKSAGLYDNTIVIFTSDNGGVISENVYPFARVENDHVGRFSRWNIVVPDKQSFVQDSPLRFICSSNAPLRNEKGSIYEGGIRVPLIIRWPGKTKGGPFNHAPVISNDFYLTLMEMGGVKSAGYKTDGKSIVPELTSGNFDPERTLFWHYPVFHHDVPGGAIRKGDWKLVENFMDGSLALYNLKYDISETTNLIDDYKDKAGELHGLLKEWQKDVGAEFPVPNPDFDPARRHE